MKKLETLLAAWRAAEPQQVALADLHTDPALQARAIECIGWGSQKAEEDHEDNMVMTMAARLKGNPSEQVEPLLVLRRTDGELLVFDGHHRLTACEKAKRDTVPARVQAVDWETAVMASKLVNLGGEKLTMHAEQRADAAWQSLAKMTCRGHTPLPEGVVQRGIATRFGISPGTVNGMLKRLRERSINPATFDPAHCDPGTGWPRWRFARNPNYGKDWAPPDPDAKRQRAVAKLARQIAEAVEKFGPGVLSDAIAMARQNGMDADAIDEAQWLAEEIDPPDY